MANVSASTVVAAEGAVTVRAGSVSVLMSNVDWLAASRRRHRHQVTDVQSSLEPGHVGCHAFDPEQVVRIVEVAELPQRSLEAISRLVDRQSLRQAANAPLAASGAAAAVKAACPPTPIGLGRGSVADDLGQTVAIEVFPSHRNDPLGSAGMTHGEADNAISAREAADDGRSRTSGTGDQTVGRRLEGGVVGQVIPIVTHRPSRLRQPS